MNAKSILKATFRAAENKKAEDIVVLNMQGVSLIADYFLICHGSSEKQVQAIAKEVVHSVEELGLDVKKVEGLDEARWVLIDMGDVVAHIFHREERSYYNLERLWGDAPMENLQREIAP
ncbi:ribosome silencing factor [Siminovitchia sp. FSL H7-0308]|uniref:Ribosomal silencing factor RsfS n=1 Tax=Siminovitchia thermophila TaxID=1245522 RepID=A0ABS2RB09_9BACI|nr:ribosome silencing factor [Siminovitchia thermophila]MBM7716334.1 ribosome-associated protein [Siminovitchia thermophila]ONK24174.1 ribosome silencing factor [Bacillus sp. VT-16-64]